MSLKLFTEILIKLLICFCMVLFFKGYFFGNLYNLKKNYWVLFHLSKKYRCSNWKFVLNIGIYEDLEYNLQKIKSIRVPPGYYVFLFKHDKITPIYGPFQQNFINPSDFDLIIIQKHLPGNSLLCGDNNICLTFGKGIVNSIFFQSFVPFLHWWSSSTGISWYAFL